MAQQRSALLDVLVPVVVERHVGIGSIRIAGADQSTATRVPVVVVRHRHVRDSRLHIEQRVIAIGFTTAGFQRVVVDPDVVDRELSEERRDTGGQSSCAAAGPRGFPA